MNHNKTKIALVAALLACAGAAQAQTASWPQESRVVAPGQGVPPPTLESLLADSVKAGSAAAAAAEVPTIRAQAIQEAAASLGARAGLARGITDIDAALKSRVAVMDTTYNFSSLALSVPMRPGEPATYPDPKRGNGEYAMVLPAVIVEGRDSDAMSNDEEMRIADRTYKIVQKERLIPVDKATGKPAVPDWRDYLVFSFREVEMPHPSLMPKTDGEKAIWNEWVARGWEEGTTQAKQMLDNGWARLDRDFKGMLNYQRAYAQGLVTRPQVAGVNMGVTGNGNEMRLNDRAIRITDHTTLVPDSSRWSTTDPK